MHERGLETIIYVWILNDNVGNTANRQSSVRWDLVERNDISFRLRVFLPVSSVAKLLARPGPLVLSRQNILGSTPVYTTACVRRFCARPSQARSRQAGWGANRSGKCSQHLLAGRASKPGVEVFGRKLSLFGLVCFGVAPRLLLVLSWPGIV